MATDYYTNERDYRPSEGAFDGTEYRYQEMERDPNRAEPVGSEAMPRNYRGDYDDASSRRRYGRETEDYDRGPNSGARNDARTNGFRRSSNRDFERDFRENHFARRRPPSEGRRAMFDRSNDKDRRGEDDMYAELGPGPDARQWQRDYLNHPGYASPNHSPYGTGSQYGGNQTLESQSFQTTADRQYVRADQHGGKGPKGYRRSSPRIHEEICEALMWSEDIDASDIEVQVEDCQVTLTGEVSNRQMKRLAEDLAEAVRGVEDVHNQLRVRRHTSEASDSRSKSNRKERGENPQKKSEDAH